MSVASFGGVGDGRTLNTQAFAAAVARIQRRRAPGGALLYVPPGVWLTGPFSLASHMTLFLARGAVIRATQVTHTDRHCSCAPLLSHCGLCILGF
jgi:polygalacturonase